MCNSFSVNTCLMLAVITLYYCPSQGHYSFAFVVNFEKVLSFDRYSYFAHFFIIITISIIYHFIFCYYCLYNSENWYCSYYQCFFLNFSLLCMFCHMVVCLFHVSYTLWFIFHAYLLFLSLTLSKYILHRCKFNTL